MKNSDKIFVGLLTGLVTGFVAGVLLAPDKGEKTREKIAQSAKSLSYSVGETLNKENIGNAVNTAKAAVSSWMKKGKEVVEAVEESQNESE